eukprot:s5162_g4.t1
MGLAPPHLLGMTAAQSHLLVPVSKELSIDLLEAALPEQERFVEDALESTGAAEGDPYGVVLWPAAQVVAAVLLALLLRDGSRRRIVELGCGTGLCSLAASTVPKTVVLATDYRQEPLELLQQAAVLNRERLQRTGAIGTSTISTKCLDFTQQAAPEADVVVAADLLYLRSASEALARGCIAALRAGSHILVGDSDRPGRQAFLSVLRPALRGDRGNFERLQGWSLALPRHELISTSARTTKPRALPVGLMYLQPDDLA